MAQSWVHFAFHVDISIMYSIYNCYRNVSTHLNRVMSPDDDTNEGGEGLQIT